jgi:hypothetical protein
MRYALAIAALFALSVDASAEALIPKEMQGTWCSATGSPLTEEDTLSPEASIQDNCQKIVVHARGFRGEGLNCTAVKVSLNPHRGRWGPIATIKVKCGRDFTTMRWECEKDYIAVYRQ